MLIPVWRSLEQSQWKSSSLSASQPSATYGKSHSQQGHRCMGLFQQFTSPPSWWELFLFSSTSRPPPRRSVQGPFPPSQSGPTACPGTPCHRSVQQHTVLSDGPPGRGPNTPRLRRTPSGCPVVGAIEQQYHSIILNVVELHKQMDLEQHRMAINSCYVLKGPKIQRLVKRSASIWIKTVPPPTFILPITISWSFTSPGIVIYSSLHTAHN